MKNSSKAKFFPFLVGYEKEESPLISIDPHGRCILLQIYRGIGTLLNLTLNEHNNVHFYRYNYSSKKSIDHHVIPKEIKDNFG